MPVVNKVGLEAEFLLRNSKGELVIPPKTWDHDGFPLLGEIRGKEGENIAQTMSNFITAKMNILGKLAKDHKIQLAARERCPLAVYRKANRIADLTAKQASMGQVKNIHGIDIEDFSDQIIEKGRIQGIWVSCGLHVHFSCEEYKEVVYTKAQYEEVTLPLKYAFAGISEQEANGLKVVGTPSICLHKYAGYELKETLKCRASRLTKPAVHHIVSEMDRLFFNRFAPPEKERTKYRQPGFFELKPYGFEYRSLPMTDDIEAAMYEIAATAFGLLEDLNNF